MNHKMEKKLFEKKKKIMKKIFFLKKLFCEKVPSLNTKMMIYQKMSMSGVYKNVKGFSENLRKVKRKFDIDRIEQFWRFQRL